MRAFSKIIPLALLLAGAGAARAQDVFMAPPPAVTAQQPAPPASTPETHVKIPRGGGGPVQYTGFGNPSNEAQYLLELLNRARADAPTEANRIANGVLNNTIDHNIIDALNYFRLGANNGNGNGNDTTLANMMAQLQSQFASLPVQLPPLAFNASLQASSLLHSQDMAQNNFQGHNSSADVGVSANTLSGNTVGVGLPPAGTSVGEQFSGNSTVPGRIYDTGYRYSNAAENVFAYGKTDDFIHASFEIDWGGGPFGMQSPPGHRNNDHSEDDVGNPAPYREIGISVVTGPGTGNGIVTGPLIATYDLGVQQSSQPFITGVAYEDTDGNSFYTQGEGLGGIEVDVSGANYYAVTSSSGGYAVPVPGNGSYTVTFKSNGATVKTEVVTVSGGNNYKEDYIVPAITFVAQPQDALSLVGGNASFTVAVTDGGATYQWYEDSTSLGAGNTSATLTLTNLALSDAGNYSCAVSNGQGTVSSRLANLSVVSTPEIIVQSTPPPSVMVTGGGTLSLSVSAIGTGTLSYVWSRNGQALSSSSTLTLPGVTAAQAGVYTLVVSTGGVSQLVNVSVTVGPAFTTQPKSATAKAGKKFAFKVVVVAKPVAKLQWYFKNKAVKAGAKYTITLKNSSSKVLPITSTCTLTIKKVAKGDAGLYLCKATNALGVTTSAQAKLTVK